MAKDFNNFEEKHKQFELVVLKELLTQDDIFLKIFPIINSTHFNVNKDLFNLITSYYKDYEKRPSIDDCLVYLEREKNKKSKDEIIKSLNNLKELNVEINSDNLADSILSFIKTSVYSNGLDIASKALVDNNEELRQKSFEIFEEYNKITLDKDLGLSVIDDNILDYYLDDQCGIKTHLVTLNDRLGSGFLPGTLSILLAASSVGKSLFLTDLATGFIKNNKNVLFLSLEMSKEEVMKRVHSNLLEYPINSLNSTLIDKENFLKKFNKIKEDNLGKLYIKDYPPQSYSTLQLKGEIENYKLEGIEFDVIIVDYLGIMKSNFLNFNVGLYSYIKSVAEELRGLAKVLNIPILTASQLNRSATNNTSSDNSAVSDSYGTVMTADFMMFIMQNEEMKKNNEIVCKITKNRFSGITDVFTFNVDYNYMRILEKEQGLSIPKGNDFELDDFNIDVF